MAWSLVMTAVLDITSKKSYGKVMGIIGMSMGQPMVCTSIANEGIAAEPDEQILIADEAADFASAVVELLTNNEKAEMLARNARRFVEEKWTWEYYLQQLEEHFEGMVASS